MKLQNIRIWIGFGVLLVLVLILIFVTKFQDRDLVTYSNSGDGNRPFQGLAFDYPNDWSLEESKDSAAERLRLNKGSYSISFFQADAGRGECVFEDSKDDGEMSFTDLDFRDKNFVELQTQLGTFRRVIVEDDPQAPIAIFCSKQPDGSFVTGADDFGINYHLPASFRDSMLEEMDAIILSLRRAE